MNEERKQLIKYFRHEGSKLILLPSQEGCDYLASKPQRLVTMTGTTALELKAGEESVGEQKLISYSVDLQLPIVFVELNINHTDNSWRIRLHTQGQVSYFLTLPFLQPKDMRV